MTLGAWGFPRLIRLGASHSSRATNPASGEPAKSREKRRACMQHFLVLVPAIDLHGHQLVVGLVPRAHGAVHRHVVQGDAERGEVQEGLGLRLGFLVNRSADVGFHRLGSYRMAWNVYDVGIGLDIDEHIDAHVHVDINVCVKVDAFVVL